MEAMGGGGRRWIGRSRLWRNLCWFIGGRGQVRFIVSSSSLGGKTNRGEGKRRKGGRGRRERTRNRLRPARIRNIDKLLDQIRVLVMIPVAEDDRVFFVVGVDFGWRVDDDAGAEAVDVLALL